MPIGNKAHDVNVVITKKHSCPSQHKSMENGFFFLGSHSYVTKHLLPHLWLYCMHKTFLFVHATQIHIAVFIHRLKFQLFIFSARICSLVRSLFHNTFNIAPKSQKMRWGWKNRSKYFQRDYEQCKNNTKLPEWNQICLFHHFNRHLL